MVCLFKGDIALTGSKGKKSESFKEKMERLTRIVEGLESDDIELEEALAAFEEGVKLSKECTVSLSAAERKIEILMKEASGEAKLESFDPGLDDENPDDEDA